MQSLMQVRLQEETNSQSSDDASTPIHQGTASAGPEVPADSPLSVYVAPPASSWHQPSPPVQYHTPWECYSCQAVCKPWYPPEVLPYQEIHGRCQPLPIVMQGICVNCRHFYCLTCYSRHATLNICQTDEWRAMEKILDARYEDESNTITSSSNTGPTPLDSSIDCLGVSGSSNSRSQDRMGDSSSLDASSSGQGTINGSEGKVKDTSKRETGGQIASTEPDVKELCVSGLRCGECQRV